MKFSYLLNHFLDTLSSIFPEPSVFL